MSKEIYMAAHEELVNEMLEKFPDMDDDLAYKLTENSAWDRMIDKLSDIADSRNGREIHEQQDHHSTTRNGNA